MSSFLQTACAQSRQRAQAAAAERPLADLVAAAADLSPAPDFAGALGRPGVGVIAEIKRASPSRGDLADIADPAALARSYAAGGASAISVLTAPEAFKGSLYDLTTVAGAVDVPALRKDFIVDAYQIWEARLAGAGAVLLIVAALDGLALAQLIATAGAAGLDALIEVHDADEAARVGLAYRAAGALLARDTTAKDPRAGTDGRLVVGVNARDLVTLQVDPRRFGAVRDALPDNAIAVAESGVHGPDDVVRLAALGADAVLVGEHVATAADPTAAVAALVAAGAPADAGVRK